MSQLDRAAAFANALDHDDFTAARPFLHAECMYLIGSQVICGAEAILNSYRNSAQDVSNRFDEVAYHSRVSMRSKNVAVIDFLDTLKHKGWTHSHTAQLILTLNEAGVIVEIQHIDQPGAKESFIAFLVKVGID